MNYSSADQWDISILFENKESVGIKGKTKREKSSELIQKRTHVIECWKNKDHEGLMETEDCWNEIKR